MKLVTTEVEILKTNDKLVVLTNQRVYMKNCFKQAIVLSILLFLLSCNSKSQNNDKGIKGNSDPYTSIIETYHKWEKIEFEKGEFCDTCPNYSNMPDIDSASPEIRSKYDLHVVDSNFTIHFDDINGDDKMDGFISCRPRNCYGGNAEMYRPNTVILILSNKNQGYDIDTTTIPELRRKIEHNAKEVFVGKINENKIEIDNITNSNIWGNLTINLLGECHGCHSLVGEFNYDVSDKKISISYYSYDMDKDTKQKIKGIEIPFTSSLYNKTEKND